jgi:FAT domain
MHSSEAGSNVGQLWLETAKIARKAGHYQTAYSAILQAEQLKAPMAFLQSAKLKKANDQGLRAIQELDSALTILDSGSISNEVRKSYAKVRFFPGNTFI